jgi:hypothetical protein
MLTSNTDTPVSKRQVVPTPSGIGKSVTDRRKRLPARFALPPNETRHPGKARTARDPSSQLLIMRKTSLVRAGAAFRNGRLIERHDEVAA